MTIYPPNPGDKFEILEDLEISNNDIVIIAESGDMIIFDRILGKTDKGINVYRFKLINDKETIHDLDMLENQANKIIKESVRIII